MKIKTFPMSTAQSGFKLIHSRPVVHILFDFHASSV